MKDQVIGVAVLDKSDGAYEMLYVKCRTVSGKVFDTMVPVVPAGRRRKERQWEYEVEGDFLHLEPSLFMPARPFGTANKWSVRFQTFNSDLHEDAEAQFHALNQEQAIKLHD